MIDHTKCQLSLGHRRPRIYYEGYRLPFFEAIVPRIGASVTQQGAAVIRQFELMGSYSIARSTALVACRDKLHCLQQLSQSGIAVPKTVAVSDSHYLHQAIQQVNGPPVVIKLLESTHGAGVLLAHNRHNAEATLEAFQKLKGRVLLQEFIKEAKGADVRAIVVGTEVIAAMERKARPGEFRSNLHRGATARSLKLSEEETQFAVRAAELMQLDFAGVDFLRTHRGNLLLEVNASPGLEGIEGITQTDVAGAVIRHLEKNVTV